MMTMMIMMMVVMMMMMMVMMIMIVINRYGVVSQVSEGVHVGDDVVGVVLSRGKELLSQEGDEVPDDEGALAIAEPAVDLGWEVVDRGGLVDARLMDPLGEGEGDGGHVGVALAMDELEDGDEFVHRQ